MFRHGNENWDWDEGENLEELEELMPLLGHRNWIAVTDMAFPALASEGVETFWSDDELLEAVDSLLETLSDQPHIRPIVWLDEELDFVEEGWAPGITEFRRALQQRLHGLTVHKLPHEQIIAKLNEAAQQFRVIIVKTNTCLPYTSVFLELDCAYWDEEREQKLRDKMKGNLPS